MNCRVTVGAYNVLNTFAFFSNYGDCVDINAPVSITIIDIQSINYAIKYYDYVQGVYIKSTLPNGMTGTMSGNEY